jgi:hypothetical protein
MFRLRFVKAFVFTVLLLCAGSAVIAQEVPVLSGAHDGFSRLVVHMPSRIPWKMTGEAMEREIRFENATLQLDTSLVFNRIKGTRLAAVSPLNDDAGLKLFMKCTCDVTAFWHGEAMLVIDVRDPIQAERPDIFAASSVEEQVSASRPNETSLPNSFATASAATRLASQHFNDQVDNGAGNQALQIDMTETRHTLAREMARAASLGLISAQELPIALTPVDPSLESEAESPLSFVSTSVKSDLNLNALTSADHFVLKQSESGTQTTGGVSCIAPSDVEIAAWGQNDGFSRQIGAGRIRLIEELDIVNSGAALDLAKLYLYFGFGAEAIQILKLAHVNSTEVEVASAVAQILEHGHATTSILFGQLECDSDVALWSALSYDVLPVNTAINADAVLRGVSALPIHLRRILGPLLVRKFTAAGQSKSAERTLRIIDRNPAKPTTSQVFAAAEVELATGGSLPTDASLEAVVSANDVTSAEALVRRIDVRLQVGRGVPQSMADLAGAYAQEQEGTMLGYELARVYIEATAAAGSFDTAFAEMKRLFPEMPEEGKQHVIETVLEILVSDADELIFLRYADRINDRIKADLPPRMGNKIARRLLDLGFPGLAQPYLRSPANGLDLLNRRILRAEVNLKNGAPREALVNLLELDRADANIIRAKAKSQLGEHGAARLLFLSAGETEAALREALLAEDWQQVEAIADQDLVDVVLLGGSDPIASELTGVLSHNRALLDASAFAREEVEKLLKTRTLPRFKIH